MSALLIEDTTYPLTITWTYLELEQIIAAAQERGIDPGLMMKQAVMEDLYK